MSDHPPHAPTGRTPRNFPLITATVAAVAVALWLAPAAAERLIYERDAILHGQVWRLLTGHVVHFSASHLLWNLAIWLPAGAWLELANPRRMGWFAATAPGAIALLLCAADADLARYAGLSGLATGVLVLLALDRLAAGVGRGVWIATLVLVAAKVALETGLGGTLFAGLPAGIRPVPLAHAGGIAAAVGVFAAVRTRR